MSQSRLGEINRRDPPSMGGEPERVGAMTAACIERASWRQTSDFTGDMRAGRTPRDPVGALTQCACPELLPEVSIVGRCGHDVAIPRLQTKLRRSQPLATPAC